MQLDFCADSAYYPLFMQTGMTEVTLDFIQTECHFRKLQIRGIPSDPIHFIATF